MAVVGVPLGRPHSSFRLDNHRRTVLLRRSLRSQELLDAAEYLPDVASRLRLTDRRQQALKVRQGFIVGLREGIAVLDPDENSFGNSP